MVDDVGSPGPEWVTIAEAAEISGETRAAWWARIRRARQAIARGGRPAVSILRRGDGAVFVARSDAERRRAELTTFTPEGGTIS